MSKSNLLGSVYRVQLDQAGYDTASGRYYGVGAPVYALWVGEHCYDCRAADMATARRILTSMVAQNVFSTDMVL